MLDTHTTISAAVLATSLFAVGCATKAEQPHENVGLANPGSQHCIHKGGKLEMRKDSSGGEFGMCHLPDGTTIEEWDLLRRDDPMLKL